MSDSPKILNVGQCGIDGPRIQKFLEREFGASVVSAESVDDARERIGDESFQLVLTNRILDRTGEEGYEVVKAAHEQGTPVILVSNYDDAQERAGKLGAKPGFGKAALDAEETKARVAAALEG